jgi:hypothetical protein
MPLKIYTQGGKLLVVDSALASSEDCCCAPDDPDRIVKCCFGLNAEDEEPFGICQDTTAAECAFLGGRVVQDCATCQPGDPLTIETTCLDCCTANEIDVLVTAFISDPVCRGIFGSGCNATRRYGRRGESIAAQAQVTLSKFGCNYSFSACAPLGTFGNFTRLSLQAGFRTSPDNVTCSQNNPCTCQFRIISAGFAYQTCGFSDNSDPSTCTQPASGGTCLHSLPTAVGQSVAPDIPNLCTGAFNRTDEQTIQWNSFSGCWDTFAPLTPGGGRRDIGNETCPLTIPQPITGETEHTVFGRLSVRIV